MNGAGTKLGCVYKEPTPEEREHILQHHIEVLICTTDNSARIVVTGECEREDDHKHGHEHKCTTTVASFLYCKRPPC